MKDRAAAAARARRQERVAKVVWGTFFVAMGVLFTLNDMGKIDLGEPRSQFGAENAVDGNPKTRWSSAFRDPQWLAVDLGAEAAVGRVRLEWEDAYATQYDLQVSRDGKDWTTVRHVTDGHGGTEEQELGTTARYVRLLGTRRSTPYGFSLWEMQVFDSSGNLVSQGKAATTSSTEDNFPFALWVRFWPLVLVASGLPLLIAPRDDASQILGMALTAVGGFGELHALGYVTWGIRQISSAVLIVVGLVILLQSQRGGESSGEGGAGTMGSAS
jgi:F5/8 type C domain-containing protein/cell wall-active antibiotic response 4TMS protein YvqF